jgi:hypothetical protein
VGAAEAAAGAALVTAGLTTGTITLQNLGSDLWAAMSGEGASKAAGLHRPYIRKPVRADVEASAPLDASGRPIDPNTGAPIEGKPDLGHKPGHEFRREKAAAEAEGLMQKEFNDKMNDPDLYQLEGPSSNRSRKYEQKP